MSKKKRHISLDQHDHAILLELQTDGRMSNVVLAERINLSESATLRRVRALEQVGLIEGYSARIDQALAGLSGNVFVNITLQRQDQQDLEVFEEAVQRVPEVMECYLMSGNFDYLLRVVVADTADFERIHSQKLTRLPGVSRVQSSFALRTVRKSSVLPTVDG
ncbi:MAG TPA: Lrp/AsnC family transcriptional regulator [Gammaproteobacteria bacterium]|jgi:DNA-binding Lrp family transcriptional regulator|nr:Lrp/AsnC family transcriptional regulator [Gammaproteobacteria bacterium]HJP39100.1 Lrp/AsnC family transcriptional regulator [Gammaproteobacteria bacterium]